MRPMKGQVVKTTDATCVPCQYYCYGTDSCDYFLMTKKRRGCPAGDGCEQFTRRSRRKKFGTTQWYQPSMVEKMRKCYDQGLTDTQIAMRLGVSMYSVTCWRLMEKLPAQQTVQRTVREESDADWI